MVGTQRKMIRLSEKLLEKKRLGREGGKRMLHDGKE